MEQFGLEIIAEICRFLPDSDVRSLLLALHYDEILKSRAYLKYMFLNKYAGCLEQSLNKWFDSWALLTQQNWMLGYEVVHMDFMETQCCESLHAPCMLSVSSHGSHGNLLCLSPQGHLVIVTDEEGYSNLVFFGLAEWRVHHENGSANTSYMVFPRIPLVPRPFDDSNFKHQKGKPLVTATYVHPAGARFVQFCNRGSYFLALDSNGDMWANAYDSLLSPMVRLRYDFNLARCTPISNETELESLRVESAYINDKYDYCVVIENRGFLIYHNGMRLHHKTYMPNLRSIDMRPFYLSFDSLGYSSEEDLLGWTLGLDKLFFIDRSSRLFVLPINLVYCNVMRAIIYEKSEPMILEIPDTKRFQKMISSESQLLLLYEDAVMCFDFSDQTPLKFVLPLKNKVRDIRLKFNRDTRVCIIYMVLQNSLASRVVVDIDSKDYAFTYLCKYENRVRWECKPNNALRGVVSLLEHGFVVQPN